MRRIHHYIALSLLVSMILLGFTGCHGKFALVRKTYTKIDSLQWGQKGTITRKIIRSTVFGLVTFTIGIYIGLADYLFLNVYEFWTNKNLIGYNEYDENGKYVRHFRRDNHSITFIYSDFGNSLQFVLNHPEHKPEQFFLFHDKPGQIFIKQKHKMQKIDIKSRRIGSKIILQMLKNGELQSSRIVDMKDEVLASYL